MLIYVLFAFIYVCFTFCVRFVFRYIWLILCKKKISKKTVGFHFGHLLCCYRVLNSIYRCPLPFSLPIPIVKIRSLCYLCQRAAHINLNSSTGLWIVNIKNFYRDTFMIGSSRNIFQVWKTTPSLPRWLISVMIMRVRTLTHTKQWNAKRR